MSHRPKSTGIDAALDALQAALGDEGVTMAEARAQGFVTSTEYAKRSGVGRSAASDKLLAAYKGGTLERVKICNANLYAYRPAKR